jgi:TolA-binding protein
MPSSLVFPKRQRLLLIWSVVGALCLGAGFAGAQSPAPAPSAPAAAPAGAGMSGFMEKLRMKVEQLTPQKQVSTTTAVGGVRGSAVAAADVYWKGEAKPQTIDAAELEAFQKGVALVESDQKAQALVVFTEFAKTYPESILKADAEEIMRHLAGQPVAQ